jgi:uncharacterized protein
MKTHSNTLRQLLCTALILSVILITCGFQNQSEKKHWIYDNENDLADNQEAVLDSIISDFEMRTSNEIVVLTVNDIGDAKNLSDFAVDFGQRMGIGKKDKNNGLVILFSKNMRKTWLSTGYGTEKILKDEICKAIIDSTMIPYFKNQDYFGGLKSGVIECIKRWK